MHSILSHFIILLKLLVHIHYVKTFNVTHLGYSVEYFIIELDAKALFIMKWHHSCAKNITYINITKLSSHHNTPNLQKTN